MANGPHVLSEIQGYLMQLAQTADSAPNDLARREAEDALMKAEEYLVQLLSNLSDKVSDLEGFGVEASVHALDKLAKIATDLDSTGIPELQKQASVLDEILLTIGARKGIVAALRRKQDDEVERLRSEAKDEYTKVKEEHDKQNKVDDTRKLISDAVKEFRPMEAGLSTRTCPDHPGAQMARIAEATFQCSLDKAVYNYESGFSTMKGNKIPGGDVSNQTQALYDRPNEFMSFDTRESKLNQG